MRSRRIEERRARAAHAACAERNAPDARHGERQPSPVRPSFAARRVHVDAAAAEIRDEQVAAETAETLRCERDAPRLVELLLVPDARDQAAVEIELVDVAPGRRVVAVHRSAVSIAHEDPPADGLDSVRRVPVGDRAVDEAAAGDDTPPAGVVDEHAVVVEVGSVQPAGRESDTPEDRRGAALVDRNLRLARPATRDDGRPAPDRPVLTRVDEPHWACDTAAANDESARTV